MVKRDVAGIPVPKTATNAELRCFVDSVYEACDRNYSHTAKEIGVHPNTIRKLVMRRQHDSHIVRDKLGIRRTKPRPRVWMPTNNVEAAIEKLFENYDYQEIYETMIKRRWADEKIILHIYEVEHYPYPVYVAYRDRDGRPQTGLLEGIQEGDVRSVDAD